MMMKSTPAMTALADFMVVSLLSEFLLDFAAPAGLSVH
jgi:hypothetical protein